MEGWDTLCGMPLNPALKKSWRPWADPKRMLQFPNRVQVRSGIFYAVLRPHEIDGVRGKLALCLNERPPRECTRVAPQ